MFEHWGGTIYWDALTWEAAAAILAVIGAIIVGTVHGAVLRRQAELQSMANKVAVWKERLAVYDATRAYLGHVVTKASVPGRLTLAATITDQRVTAPETWAAFTTALDRAQFLFSRAVYERLEKLWRAAEALADERASADNFYSGDQSEADRLRDEIVAAHADLAAVFGEELRLSSDRPEGRG